MDGYKREMFFDSPFNSPVAPSIPWERKSLPGMDIRTISLMHAAGETFPDDVRKPIVFSNDGVTDPHDFLKACEDFALAAGMTEEEMLRQLVLRLRGYPYHWWQSQRLMIHTWLQFRREFLGQFLPDNYQQHLQRKIWERLQNEGEPLSDYVAALEMLFSRFVQPISHSEKITQILQNIHPYFRQRLTQRYDSVHDLLKAGARIEQEIRDQRRYWQIQNARGNSPWANSDTHLPPTSTPFQQANRQFLSVPPGAPVRRGDASPAHIGPPTPTRPMSCYGCGRPNTFRRNCPICNPVNNVVARAALQSLPMVDGARSLPNPAICRDTVDLSPILVELTVNGRAATAEVDTGSTFTILSQDWSDFLLSSGAKFEEWRGPPLLLANGDTWFPVVSTEVTITLLGRPFFHRILLVPGASSDCLLGGDFLRQHRIRVDPLSGGVALSSDDICDVPKLPLFDETRLVRSVKREREDDDSLCQNKRPRKEASSDDPSGMILFSVPVDDRLPASSLTIDPSGAGESLSCPGDVLPAPVSPSVDDVSSILDFSVDNGRNRDVLDLRDANQSDDVTGRINDLLDKYATLFDGIGNVSGIQHEIHLTDSSPVSSPPYRVNPAKRNLLNAEIETLLEKGLIRPSTSPWAGQKLTENEDADGSDVGKDDGVQGRAAVGGLIADIFVGRAKDDEFEGFGEEDVAAARRKKVKMRMEDIVLSDGGVENVAATKRKKVKMKWVNRVLSDGEGG